MWSRTVMITSGIILAGYFVFGQPSELSGTLEQFRETLKKLQAEVKSLQEAVKQLPHEAKKKRLSEDLRHPDCASFHRCRGAA